MFLPRLASLGLKLSINDLIVSQSIGVYMVQIWLLGYNENMDTVIQSDVFFFISSIGFVVLWILTAIFLFYLIRTMNTFSRIMNKIEKDIDKIGDTTLELVEDMRESPVFRFILGRRRRSRKE